jgi:negative regulator of flagellin synthesis FlgM
MHIYGPAHLHGPQPVGPPHTSRVSKPAAPDVQAPIHDEVDISDAARLIDRVSEIPEIRQDRVDTIRAQIAQGVYETDEKLQIALDRLLDEIG